MNRSYLEGKTVGMNSRIITIKDMYRLGHLRKFPLSLLPSTTPNISNKNDAVKLIANQVQHAHKSTHPFHLSKYWINDRKNTIFFPDYVLGNKWTKKTHFLPSSTIFIIVLHFLIYPQFGAETWILESLYFNL